MIDGQRDGDASSGVAEMYGKLARGLKSVGELSMALQVCDRGIKKFPNHSNIYIIKSQILISRFKDDNNQDHLKTALSNLDKALALDPQSYIAKLLASRICLNGKAYNRARALLADILKAFPDDEKASALMASLEKMTRKKEKPAKPAKAKQEAKEGKKEEKKKEEKKPEAEAVATEEKLTETEQESSQLIIDEKMVIESEEADDEAIHHETMVTKLTMFGRLDGLEAIFLVDSNGQPFKVINKAGLDENLIPSMVFNLYKASVTGVRRIGYGSFQRGTLVTPFGTIFIVNAFYATLALVVENDANLQTVEARIQRYLNDVAV